MNSILAPSLQRIRSSKRSRFLLVLIAALGLMHVQALYACADMADTQGATRSETCCCSNMEELDCDDRHDCSIDADTVPGEPCCATSWLITAEPGGQAAALSKLDSHQPQALAADPSASGCPSADCRHEIFLSFREQTSAWGNTTYLHTRRLRL